MIHTKSERGQTMVIFAVALVGLLAFIGLATDAGQLYVERRNAQSAADSAAFAAAAAKVKGKDLGDAGEKAAAANGFDNDGTTNTVSVYEKPISGPYKDNPDYVQVIITSEIKTSFLHIFGRNSIHNTSEAVVQATTDAPALGSDALVGANPSDCDTIYANGGTSIEVNNGNVFSNSDSTKKTSNCYALMKNGEPGHIKVTNGTVRVVDSEVGYTPPSKLPDIEPWPVELNQTQKTFEDIPVPDCDNPANFAPYSTTPSVTTKKVGKDDYITYSPGVYDTIKISGNPFVTFESGLYCINGDFTANGGAVITGNNVMFVMNGGNYDLGGGTKTTFSAHASEYKLATAAGKMIDYADMLILADPSTYSLSGKIADYTLSGNAGATYTGTIYIPEVNCKINGTPSQDTILTTQMICNKVTVDGGGTITIQLVLDAVFHGDGSIALMQ